MWLHCLEYFFMSTIRWLVRSSVVHSIIHETAVSLSGKSVCKHVLPLNSLMVGALLTLIQTALVIPAIEGSVSPCFH
jgi:hypothetical protein